MRIVQLLRNRLPLAALLALAIAAGVAWRLELELAVGWRGIAWTRHSFVVVPVFIALFLLWVVIVANVRRYRWAFAGVLVVWALVSHYFVAAGLTMLFASGPRAMLVIIALGDNGSEKLELYTKLLLFVWPAIPLAFCGICRLFGHRITLARAVLSCVLFTSSWFLGALLWQLFSYGDYPDLIHALKSGFVIPFLVFFLGMPLLRTVPEPGRAHFGEGLPSGHQ